MGNVKYAVKVDIHPTIQVECPTRGHGAIDTTKNSQTSTNDLPDILIEIDYLIIRLSSLTTEPTCRTFPST